MTHLLKDLVKECSKHDESFNGIMKDARYPNGLIGDLAPTEFYEREDAERCINSIEPLVYNTKEFEELKNSENPFIKEVLKTAINL